MSTIEQRDLVRELDTVPFPDPEGPDPLVLADEDTVVAAYRSAGLEPGRDASCLVVFRQCYASHFGPPNDDAFASHPLAERGLRAHGAFEVENSTWIRALKARNRGHPRHDPRVFEQMRHWVWTFHDTVLECAALSFATEQAPGRPLDLVSRMEALVRAT